MKLLEIIAQAREKGIMPDLKEGIYLVVDKDKVKAYNSKKRYRTVFVISDCDDVELASTLVNSKEPKYAIGKTNPIREWFEIEQKSIVRTVSTQIGQKLEEIDHEITYKDVNGKTILHTEKINKVVPVYSVEKQDLEIDVISFLKGDE